MTPALTVIPAYAGMTVRDAGNDGCLASPLWIAGQVCNDVRFFCFGACGVKIVGAERMFI